MSNEKVIFTCAASLLSLLVAYIGYTALTAKKYVSRSKVKRLMIYPIKSLPGVEVDHLEILNSMVRYKNFLDRSWLLLDEDNRMITLRNEPLLSRIKSTLLDDSIQLEADNMPPLKIPAVQPLKKGDKVHTINVFGQQIDGQDCGEEVNAWFNKFLGRKGCKLVRHQPAFGYRKTPVNVNGEIVEKNGKNLDILYHDGAPIHLINETSIRDLNKRIQQEHGDENPPEVIVDRFRPNVFFETDKALEEDTWKHLKINNAEFEFLIECARCKMTTFNKETHSYEVEPLRTLKQYRLGPYKLFKEAPKMGIYMKPIRTGKIHVGDEILAAF